MSLDVTIVTQILLRNNFLFSREKSFLSAAILLLLNMACLVFCYALAFLVAVKLNGEPIVVAVKHLKLVTVVFFFVHLVFRVLVQRNSGVAFSNYWKVGTPRKVLMRVFLIINCFNYYVVYSFLLLTSLYLLCRASYTATYCLSLLLLFTVNNIVTILNLLAARNALIRPAILFLLLVTGYLYFLLGATASQMINGFPVSFGLLIGLVSSIISGIIMLKYFLQSLSEDFVNDRAYTNTSHGNSFSAHLTGWYFTELRFIFRNSRIKNLLVSACVIPVILIAHTHNFQAGELLSNFVVLLGCTSILTISYGQYIFSWNANFISLIVSAADKKMIWEYVRAKYFILLTLSVTMSCSVILLYAVHGLPVLPAVCISLYTVFILPPIFLLAGIYYSTRVNIHSHGFFASWDGATARSYFPGIIFYACSFGSYYLFQLMESFKYMYIIYGVMGLTACLIIPFFINTLARLFSNRKYIIYESLKA